MPEVGYFTGLLHKLHYWLAIRFTTNYTQLTIWALVVCYNETTYYAATRLKATSSVIVIGEKSYITTKHLQSDSIKPHQHSLCQPARELEATISLLCLHHLHHHPFSHHHHSTTNHHHNVHGERTPIVI